MTQLAKDGVCLNQTEHRIGNTTYIVKSAVKKDAEQIILAKIRSLILKEYNKNFA